MGNVFILVYGGTTIPFLLLVIRSSSYHTTIITNWYHTIPNTLPGTTIDKESQNEAYNTL